MAKSPNACSLTDAGAASRCCHLLPLLRHYVWPYSRRLTRPLAKAAQENIKKNMDGKTI
jgi:hypothetical protein